MVVKIPVGADVSGVAQAFDEIRSAFRRAGQEGVDFAKIDLSHPELKDMAAEIRKIQQNFEDLTKVARGSTAAAARAFSGPNGVNLFGQGGMLNGGLARLYPSPAAQQRIIQQTGSYVFQGTRYAPPPPAPPPRPAPSPPGGSGGGGAGGSGEGVNPLSVMAGPVKALLAMAGVSKLVDMIAQAVGQAQQEAIANDVLMRHMRDTSTSFGELRDSVRKTADGLQLTYGEAQRYSLMWTKLTNESGAAIVSGHVRDAVGFARGNGMDVGATVGAMGRAKYLGEDPKVFAALIAEGVRAGNQGGQTEDVMNALLHWTETASRSLVTKNDDNAFMAMYSGLNATGIPGLKGANAESLINTINSSVKQGGAAGDASMALSYNALSKHGVTDPYEMQYLLEGGMFESPKSALGHGDNTSVFDAMREEINRQYAGRSKYERLNAISRQFGITERQAEALDSFKPGDITKTQRYLTSQGLDLSKVDPSALTDISQVVGSSDSGLDNWRKNLIARTGKGSLSADEKKRLGGESGDALRGDMVKLLASHGMETTQGTETSQAMADMTNSMTRSVAVLVPVINDLKGGISKLTNVVGDVSEQLAEYYGLKVRPAASGALATVEAPVPEGLTRGLGMPDRYVDPKTGKPIPTPPGADGSIADTSMSPEQKRFLRSLSAPESGGDYSIKNGGSHFSDFSHFPEGVGPGGTSTGSGRYQFTRDTWQDVSTALGLKDISPISQDRGAWYLAVREYKAKTGRDLLSDLKQGGHNADIATALHDRWPSTSPSTNYDSTGGLNEVPRLGPAFPMLPFPKRPGTDPDKKPDVLSATELEKLHKGFPKTALPTSGSTGNTYAHKVLIEPLRVIHEQSNGDHIKTEHLPVTTVTPPAAWGASQ